MKPLDTTHPLVAERLKKREKWKELGFDYPTKFDRTHTASEAKIEIEAHGTRDTKSVMADCQSKKMVCGRIMQMRDMGKLIFMQLRDVSGDLQICLSETVLSERFTDWKGLLDLGDIIGVSGEFFSTKHGEPSLMASSVTPLSKALRPLPEKFHGLTDTEAQYRQRYLDLATNPETVSRFRSRSRFISAVREFLDARDFLEVETRVLQPQAGGAMAQVFETHHNALDKDFALRIALELDLKMLTVGGLERVYEIGKCFRNEGIDPSHLQEFTMLEWYAAYADIEQNMKWCREMLLESVKKAFGKTSFELSTKGGEPLSIELSEDWEVERFPDLLQLYAQFDMLSSTKKEAKLECVKLGMPSDEAEKMGYANLLDFIYKKTARPHLLKPTFVLDYPADLKPLARPNGDGTASCYQLLIGGWEVVNAYGELVDPTIQRELLKTQAAAKAAGDVEAMNVDNSFLAAMEHGMLIQTGFGMGIDRIVALFSGQSNLKDVVFFPMMKE